MAAISNLRWILFSDESPEAEWHADAEAVLLETGSEQDNIWGGDWVPSTRAVEFESMVNISSHRGNYGNVIWRLDVRAAFEEIVREHFDH